MNQMVGNNWIRIGLTAFASGLCLSAEASGIVNGSWKDFGVENPDTVISLNCQELLTNAHTPLFYAGIRKNFTVEADMKLNARVTEQAFICKEGGKGEVVGDLTIGFDPEEEMIFVEVKDEAGDLHRIKAGDKVEMGQMDCRAWISRWFPEFTTSKKR